MVHRNPGTSGVQIPPEQAASTLQGLSGCRFSASERTCKINKSINQEQYPPSIMDAAPVVLNLSIVSNNIYCFSTNSVKIAIATHKPIPIPKNTFITGTRSAFLASFCSGVFFVTIPLIIRCRRFRYAIA